MSQDLLFFSPNFLRVSRYPGAEPMWKVIPTRDENGKLLSDFMMLIPSLRDQTPLSIQAILNTLANVLTQHRHVRFVNVNVALNLLWVSHLSLPGAGLEIAGHIQDSVPEALLIAQKLGAKSDV